MNTCHFDAALLDAYTEGDLFLDDMIQVQKHLDTCPDCQAYVDDLLAIRAAFPKVEDTVVPPDFTANVMAAVAANPRVTAAEAPVETPAKATKKKTPWLRVLVPLAACFAIVIAVQGLGGGSKNTMATTAKTKSEPAVYAAQDAKEAAADTAADNTSIATTSIEEETVSQEILSDSSRTEPAQENTGGVTAGGEAAPTPTAEEKGQAVVYQAVLTLPAEAAELLADFAPAEETETELHYHLFMSDCALIQARLEEANIPYTAEEGVEPNTSKALIILAK